MRRKGGRTALGVWVFLLRVSCYLNSDNAFVSYSCMCLPAKNATALMEVTAPREMANLFI